MLLPWVIGLFLLTLIPLMASLVLSITRVDPQRQGHGVSWIGTEHFHRALTNDTAFYTALSNSLFFTLLAAPLGLGTSLAVALLLHQPVRGAPIFRALVYLPHLLGGVATIVIWSWTFNPQFGWINQAIRLAYAAMDPIVRVFTENGTSDWLLPRWLYSPGGCKPAAIIMSAWTFGASMLIFLAALHRVPNVLHDAAQLDGAGAWQRFRRITLPHITPAILFNLTFGIIFSMQSFNEAYLLQNRQQNDGLLFYVLYLYRTAFEPPYQLGYACALAWIFLAVLLILILPLLLSARKWVYYASEK